MQIKYQVEQLEKGMYVSELDRPWEGTPFLFQGFIIETDEDLEQLHTCCKFVFVDDLKSRNDTVVQQKLHAAVKGSTITTIEFQEWTGLDKLRTTIKKVSRHRDAAVTTLTQIAESDASDKDEYLHNTRNAIVDLIEDIAEDPKTSQWMRILSEQNVTMGRHAVNTSTLAVGYAAHLGWDARLQAQVGHGAMLHDVGMSKIPQKILEKPKALSKVEFGLVKLHPGYAATRLAGANLDPEVLDIVRHHHERLDGSGYPDGLTGDMLTPHVQLVSICDIYDAYTTDQYYRPRLTSSAAVAGLTRRAGTHFDKSLVEGFIRWIGIYPLGSLVRLNNDATAIIVASDETKRLHPTVLLVTHQNGQPMLPRRTLNLSFIEEAGLLGEWGLKEIVDQRQARIDVRQILLEEMQLR